MNEFSKYLNLYSIYKAPWDLYVLRPLSFFSYDVRPQITCGSYASAHVPGALLQEILGWGLDMYILGKLHRWH